MPRIARRTASAEASPCTRAARANRTCCCPSFHRLRRNQQGGPMTHAAEIRSKLGHPVIDGDGHWMEPIPVFLDHLAEVGGARSVDQIRASWRRNDAWYRATAEE